MAIVVMEKTPVIMMALGRALIAVLYPAWQCLSCSASLVLLHLLSAIRAEYCMAYITAKAIVVIAAQDKFPNNLSYTL